MRKITIIILAVFIGLCAFDVSHAADSVNVTVSAQIPNNSAELSVIIKELTVANQEPWTGTTVTAMNFGTLTHTLTGGAEAGVWYSQKYYCVFIFTNSYGHRYQIVNDCLGLSSGGNSLPAGSFGLTPQYQSLDEWSASNPQGGQPSGSSVGVQGPAIATNKVIYQSEPAASNRIIRAFYGLPSYATGGALPHSGYQPIPLSQAPGTYTGQVTITIVSI